MTHDPNYDHNLRDSIPPSEYPRATENRRLFVQTAPRDVKELAILIAAVRPDPEAIAQVQISYPNLSRNRFYSFVRYEGPRAKVLGAVSHKVVTDSCTQCYEHMLYQLHSAERLPDDRLAVTLSHNNYAGD